MIAACNAANNGDLDTLKALKAKGVNLSQGNYDKRTPLHIAAGAGLL